MTKRVEVCTICTNRILNALCREGVCVDKVRRKGRTLSFDVPLSSAADVRRCLDDMRLDYRIYDVGLSAVARFLRRRPVLWIGAALASLAIIVALQVVWSVRITCPDFLMPAVRQVLAEEGVLSPIFATKVDTRRIQSAVSTIDGVALASVYVKGVYLNVDVKEELPPAEIERYQGPIVAQCDCVISRVVVERGRAMVQAGQSVRRGDVLIAPEYLIDKDADVTVPTQAVGEVYGYVYPASTYLYDEEQVQTVPTGNVSRTAVIEVAGRRFGEGAPSPYASYQTQVDVIRLGGVVPVVIERTVYIETRQETRFAPWLVAKEEVLQYCYSQIESQIKKDVQILRKWCIIDTMGSIHRVRAYAEVEQMVGVYYDEE